MQHAAVIITRDAFHRLYRVRALAETSSCHITSLCSFMSTCPRRATSGTQNGFQQLEEEGPAWVTGMKKAFHRAVQRKGSEQAYDLWRKLKVKGYSEDWMHNALINMHAWRREPQEAFNLAKEMQSRLDSYSYSALLNACSKAQHQPYDLPPEYANKAREIFDEMVSRGIEPLHQHYHTLMDCQAKAGQVEQAIVTLQQMADRGIQPNTYTLNIVLSACARAIPRKPFRAVALRDMMTKRYGMKPDLVTWNTLLSAFSKAQHVDGAYEVWLQMQKAGVAPDHFTLKLVSEAFAGNLALASKIMREAQQLMVMAGGPSIGESFTTRTVDRHSGLAPEDYAVPIKLQLSRPFRIDLHRMSQASARIALLQRLEDLTSKHILPSIQEGRTQLETGTMRGIAQLEGEGFREGPDVSANLRLERMQGLEIIVGQGRHSFGPSVLKDAVSDLLASKGIAFEQGSNPGIVYVNSSALVNYIERQKNAENQRHFSQIVRMQQVLVVLGLSVVLSSVYVVPVILKHV